MEDNLKLGMGKTTNKDKDIEQMCTGLMKEMLWDTKPSVVEKYSVKKHLIEIPDYKDAFKDCPIMYSAKNDYADMKTKVSQAFKPQSYIKLEVDNEIQDGKLPANSGMNLQKAIEAQYAKKTIEMSIRDYCSTSKNLLGNMNNLLAYDRSKHGTSQKTTKLVTPELYTQEKTIFRNTHQHTSTVFSSARQTAAEEGDYKGMSGIRSVVNDMRLSTGLQVRSRHMRNMTNAEL